MRCCRGRSRPHSVVYNRFSVVVCWLNSTQQRVLSIVRVVRCRCRPESRYTVAHTLQICLYGSNGDGIKLYRTAHSRWTISFGQSLLYSAHCENDFFLLCSVAARMDAHFSASISSETHPSIHPHCRRSLCSNCVAIASLQFSCNRRVPSTYQRA